MVKVDETVDTFHFRSSPDLRRTRLWHHPKKRIRRIPNSLAHKTHSIVLRFHWPDPSTHRFGNAKVFVMGHSPDVVTFGGGRIVTTGWGPRLLRFVPKRSEVYYLWCCDSGDRMTVRRQSIEISVEIYAVIFDSPSRQLGRTYQLLQDKFGSLQSGGLFHARMLQSIADSLAFQLRFRRTPDPGLASVVTAIGVEVNLESIRSLVEVATWAVEDLSMENGDVVSDEEGYERDEMVDMLGRMRHRGLRRNGRVLIGLEDQNARFPFQHQDT